MPDNSQTKHLSLRLWKRMRRLPLTLYLGGTLVTVFVVVALTSFIWTPYPPNKLNLTNRLAPSPVGAE